MLVVIVSNAQIQVGQDLLGDMPDDKFGWGIALSADGNVMAVSAPSNDNNGTGAGHIRVYAKTNGTWAQIGQDIEGANPNEGIGYKLALSKDGNTLAFSSISSQKIVNNVTYGGFVKVFKNINGTWTQMGQELREDDPSPLLWETQGFGMSFSLSSDGNTISIGQNIANNHYENNKIMIYKFILGNWIKITEFNTNNYDSSYPNADDFYPSLDRTFAWNVSLSGDGNTLVFSDVKGKTLSGIKESGVVIVYKYQAGAWSKVGNTLSGKSINIDFGHRVLLSNDGGILAISARTSSSSTGHVEVYKIIGNNWVQIGNDILGGSPKDACGQGLAMSANGNVIALGCTGCDTANGTNTGKVRIFENIQDNWIEKGSVIGADAGDGIGWSIALSGDGYNLAIGNPGGSSVGGKPNTTNLDNQTINDNVIQSNNYQGKGSFPGSVQVYDIKGILSSDIFVLENFNIYPNPTTDILNIELENNLMLENVLIYNTAGQLVKETSENRIDVSGFAKGIYNVQVITDKGKATKKLIVK